MKVTRFHQSCLLIEENNTKILIDPGVFSLQHQQMFVAILPIDAVLVTHEHADHCNRELLQFFTEKGVTIYANRSTSALLPDIEITIISDKQVFMVNELTVKAIDLPHCLLPNGQKGPQNTGFVIEDNFFHPGDGYDIDNLTVDHLALPITGPDISMKDAFSFASKLNCKSVIPIHYDLIGANPDIYRSFAANNGFRFEFNILTVGESVDL